MKRNQYGERGVAAILTVLFFTILMSVITLSFLRVAVLEQTQSLQEQLSKGAYAAAQAGIEDGKRAVLYCQGNPSDSICNRLNDPTCPGFFGDNAGKVLTTGLFNKLGLKRTSSPPSPDTNAIRVGDVSLNESYTCTIITNNTLNVQGSLNPKNLANEPASDFFPLTTPTGGITKFVLYWGKWDSSGTLPVAGDISGGKNAKDIPTQWQSSWPALMRVMILQNKGSVGFRNDKETTAGTQTKGYFVYPVQGIGSGAVLDAFGGSSVPRQTGVAYCPSTGVKDNGSPKTRWACSLTVTGLTTSSTQYLSLQASYNTTKFAVEIYNGADQVLFDSVRPTIDSTGAAGNVYRRVQATVQLGSGNNSLQPVALDALNRICKNFVVTNNPNDFSEECTTNQ